jgi:hypothetical protein
MPRPVLGVCVRDSGFIQFDTFNPCEDHQVPLFFLSILFICIYLEVSSITAPCFARRIDFQLHQLLQLSVSGLSIGRTGNHKKISPRIVITIGLRVKSLIRLR